MSNKPNNAEIDAERLSRPRLVIRKRDRVLEVYDGDRLVRICSMVIGFAPEGDKQVEGDGRTPLGDYFVCVKNPESKFHRSLGLSYPGLPDAKRGLREGLISREEHDEIVRTIVDGRMPPQKTRLGGEIYIHGGGVSGDWTEGCVALADADIENLFDAIPIGTPVTITP